MVNRQSTCYFPTIFSDNYCRVHDYYIYSLDEVTLSRENRPKDYFFHRPIVLYRFIFFDTEPTKWVGTYLVI